MAGGNNTRRRSPVAGPRRYTIEVAKHEHLQALLLRAINCTRSDSTALTSVYRKTETCSGADSTILVYLVSRLRSSATVDKVSSLQELS